MNCPTRVDPEALPNGWNQNPDTYATQMNSDTNATANRLRLQDHRIDAPGTSQADGISPDEEVGVRKKARITIGYSEADVDQVHEHDVSVDEHIGSGAIRLGQKPAPNPRKPFSAIEETVRGIWRVLRKYVKFVGPGWMVSVAYIDPGMSRYEYYMHTTRSQSDLCSHRQLCHRRSSRIFVPIQTTRHDTCLQHHSNISAVLVRETRHSHGAQPG